MALRVLFVCLFVVFAGCSAAPTTSSVDSPSPQTSTLSPGVHPGLTASLIVNLDIEEPVHVTVLEDNKDGRGLILNRTYSDTPQLNQANGLDFRTNGDYHVTISVDEQLVWNQTVSHFDIQEITVEQNRTVTVESHSVA